MDGKKDILESSIETTEDSSWAAEIACKASVLLLGAFIATTDYDLMKALSTEVTISPGW